MKTYLFVYGTLMKKSPPNKWSRLLQKNAVFIDDASIEGDLYKVSNFPGLKKGNGLVYGELYEVIDNEVFPELDDYEGFIEDDISNSLFVKEGIEVTGVKDLTKYQALVYFFNRAVHPDNKIESGRYTQSF